jgi:hypothetical protein
MCEHAAKLGLLYPGRFCVYCGAEVARFESEEGQIALVKEGRRRYVAVVFKEQQRAVEQINLEPTLLRLTFTGDRQETPVSTAALITAFQDVEEVLRIQ